MITPAMSRAAARAVNAPGVSLEDARTVAEAAITAASDAAFLRTVAGAVYIDTGSLDLSSADPGGQP